MRSANTRASRDPDFPKSIRTRRSAIERSIASLAAETHLSRAESHEVLRKIQRAIEAFEKHASYKEGVDVGDLGRVFWRKAVLAKEQAEENYRATLQKQLADSNEALRESRRTEDPYERELRLMRGGSSRDERRKTSRARGR